MYHHNRETYGIVALHSIYAHNPEYCCNTVNISKQNCIRTIPRGLTARIAGFHPAGPGSTPGVGRHFFYKSTLYQWVLEYSLINI